MIFSTCTRHRHWAKVALIAGIAACAGSTSGPAWADPGVAPQAASEPQPHSNSVGAAISDTAITAKVKANFMGDHRLKGSDISVKTTNGVVTLTGKAPTADSSKTAEELAQSVDGVKSVDNEISAPSVADKLASKADQLSAETEKVASDTIITSKLKTQLLSDRSMKGSYLSVTTTNGVVQLAGEVKSKEQIDHAEQLAQQIKGVKSVDTSALTVADNR